jgi:hypothetical protein
MFVGMKIHLEIATRFSIVAIRTARSIAGKGRSMVVDTALAARAASLAPAA